jgi:hypothetical protein
MMTSNKLGFIRDLLHTRPIRRFAALGLLSGFLILAAAVGAQSGVSFSIKLTDMRSYGNGDSGYADGSLDLARFNHPQGMAALGDGRIIIADTGNHCIRQIAASTTLVSTVLGTCGRPGPSDDFPESVELTDMSRAEFPLLKPSAIAAQPRGSTFFVADSGNRRILKVTEDSISEWPPAEAGADWRRALGVPLGLAASEEGDLFVADAQTNRILFISSAGEPVWIAGNGEPGYDPDQRDASASRLNRPVDVAVYSSVSTGFQALFVSDSLNGLIRRLRPGENTPWLITTFAGADNQTFWQDEGGAAPTFALLRPYRLAFARMSGVEMLFIGQPTHQRLLALNLTRNIEIVADSDGSDGRPQIGRPAALAFNRLTGELWMFDETSLLTRFTVQVEEPAAARAASDQSR